ncbi:hypothetical protein [Paraburkholderia strydomiana]|jgi:4-hydroxybenzoate polyprenyltransferase|uniref:hypothetical protein n=1 Tax=Paraburkholderia strydomiana TaxID=1245417 RepID=UPI0038BBCD23
MDLQRLVRLWRRGRTVIRMGLFCSFLTSLAGTLLNALFDHHIDALGPDGLVRRLIVGYAGAAAVVLLAFPFLSGGPRQGSSDDGA